VLIVEYYTINPIQYDQKGAAWRMDRGDVKRIKYFG
jgi:hypothetical protein